MSHTYLWPNWKELGSSGHRPSQILAVTWSVSEWSVSWGLAPSVVAMSLLALDSAEGGHSPVTKQIPVSLTPNEKKKKNLPSIF